jgi:hypothetical protein
MARTVNANGRTIRPAAFSTLAAARRWCEGERLWVVRGEATDAGVEFFAVRPVEAAALERAGYEIAREVM